MYVLQTAENLVHEVLHVRVRQLLLGIDYAVKVRVNHLHDDADLIEVPVLRHEKVNEGHDLCWDQLYSMLIHRIRKTRHQWIREMTRPRLDHYREVLNSLFGRDCGALHNDLDELETFCDFDMAYVFKILVISL